MKHDIMGYVKCNGQKQNLPEILMIKTKRNTALETPSCKWLDNVKVYLEQDTDQGRDFV